jgi:hypothetical protein
LKGKQACSFMHNLFFFFKLLSFISFLFLL